jgi:hypothetical protein
MRFGSSESTLGHESMLPLARLNVLRTGAVESRESISFGPAPLRGHDRVQLIERDRPHRAALRERRLHASLRTWLL